MAFYFALFNVSNVNNELRGQRKAERKERDKRRHSLASSNCLSAAKDYRLLPKPQIVLHQPDEVDYRGISSESINNRRSLSRDSIDRRGSNTTRTVRMGSNVDQLARELKKVHFRSTKRRKSKEKLNINNAEEPIWMRRQTVDLTDSHTIEPQKRISDPWVYSIDLDENPPPPESKSRSQSLTHSESWSPESPISNSTNNTNTTQLSSPKQTWLASSETLTESSSQPSVNSEQVWHKPVMGVNALEDWDNDEVEKTEEHFKDELQTHINTWPEMNAKKKIRWRPTSLIRRHSESDQLRPKRATSEISHPSVEILRTKATTTTTDFPNESNQFPGNNNTPSVISPPMPNVTFAVSRQTSVEVRPRPQILPATVASTRSARPLVITPIDSTMKKKIFRENLATLARQLGNKVNYKNYNHNVPFINEFTDPRLTCDDVMTRSNIF